MESNKQMQLENELALLARFQEENRKGVMAEMLLDRMQREINKLQREIYEKPENRHTVNEPKNTSGFIRYVLETLYRSWGYQNLCYSKILRIFKCPPSKTKESF